MKFGANSDQGEMKIERKQVFSVKSFHHLLSVPMVIYTKHNRQVVLFSLPNTTSAVNIKQMKLTLEIDIDNNSILR